MNEEEWEKDYKKVSRRNNIIFSLLMFITIILVLVIYYIVTSPFWNNGYYIVDFGEKTTLNQDEYKEIISIMNIKYDIEITKIAYTRPFRHEASYYIFYKTNDNNDENIFQDIVMNTNIDKDYSKIVQICRKYYKRWQNPWKTIDIDYDRTVNK